MPEFRVTTERAHNADAAITDLANHIAEDPVVWVEDDARTLDALRGERPAWTHLPRAAVEALVSQPVPDKPFRSAVPAGQTRQHA